MSQASDPSIVSQTTASTQNSVEQLLWFLAIDLDRSFIRLYSTYERHLRDIVAKMLSKPRNDSAVDDCVQQTFENAFRALKNKSTDDILALHHLGGWLYTIAQHVVWKYLDENKTTVVVSHYKKDPTTITVVPVKMKDDSPELQVAQHTFDEPGEVLEHQESREEAKLYLTKLLDMLSDPQRTVVERFYIQGLKSREIATQLNIPESTVKSHIRRGIKKLRSYLEIEKSEVTQWHMKN